METVAIGSLKDLFLGHGPLTSAHRQLIYEAIKVTPETREAMEKEGVTEADIIQGESQGLDVAAHYIEKIRAALGGGGE